MKKRIALLLALVCVFLLVSCDTDGQNEANALDFSFVEYIGGSVEEVCSALQIEEQLAETHQVGRYDIITPVSFSGKEFTNYLLFQKAGDNKQTLYGGGYEYITQDKGEALTELVAELKNMLTETYGAPTTYPGLSNIIGDTTDFTGFTMDTLVEDWTVTGENGGDIRLKLDFIEQNVVVKVEFIMSVA